MRMKGEEADRDLGVSFFSFLREGDRTGVFIRCDFSLTVNY